MNPDRRHNRCDVPQEPDDANGDQFFGVPEPDEIAQAVGGAAKEQKVEKAAVPETIAKGPAGTRKCFGCGAFGGNWLSCPRNPEAVGSKSHRARRLEARGMQPMHADGGGATRRKEWQHFCRQTSLHAAPRRDVGLHPGRVDIFVVTCFRASPNKHEFEFVTVTLLIRGDEHFTPVSPCSLTIFEKCLLCVCAPTQGKARKVRRQIRPNPVHPPSRLRASGKSSESRRGGA